MVLGLFGFLGGVLAFGFIGVFLGPTLLAVGYSLEDMKLRGLNDPPRALNSGRKSSKGNLTARLRMRWATPETKTLRDRNNSRELTMAAWVKAQATPPNPGGVKFALQ